MTSRDDAASITRNGLRTDATKHREWQRRSAERAAAKRRQKRNEARLTTRIDRKPPRPKPDDWPPRVRRLARKRSTGICELCAQHPACHLHHRKLRRHRDHRIENALHVCFDCHEKIHGRRRRWSIEQSKLAGWLVPAAADPAKVTTLIAGGDRVYLAADGRYEDAA